ncbi:MAG: alpha-L-rhamnosidase C-terminal domain-containing protein, partial [Candidatus Nanoarchaeia archaeon]
HYSKIAENIASAFHKKYYNPETGDYANGTQTMNAVPLVFGITPSELKEKTFQQIIKNIKQHENHFTTGFLGTTYLFRLLSDYGQDELIYKLLNQRDFPSFGRIIEAGATTMTEAWNAFLGDDFASHNHFNLGAPTEWFFRGLAGIRLLEEYPAFKRFQICPAFLPEIDFVRASFYCPYGKIFVEWARKRKEIILKVQVPVGTSAELILPAKFADSIQESVISEPSDSQKLNFDASESQAFLILESGSYNFELHE